MSLFSFPSLILLCPTRPARGYSIPGSGPDCPHQALSVSRHQLEGISHRAAGTGPPLLNFRGATNLFLPNNDLVLPAHWPHGAFSNRLVLRFPAYHGAGDKE